MRLKIQCTNVVPNASIWQYTVVVGTRCRQSSTEIQFLSGSSASESLAENCNKLNAIHSMCRDAAAGSAGQGKQEGRKQLLLSESLGFKCAHCPGEFE